MDQRFVKNSSVSFPSISDVCFKAYGLLKNYALLLSLKENTVPPSCSILFTPNPSHCGWSYIIQWSPLAIIINKIMDCTSVIY